MFNILVVSKESASLADFTAELMNTQDVHVDRATSGEEAFGLVVAGRAEVIVAGEFLVDSPALDFVKRLMKEYPLINCAMVSSLSHEEFHEVTEGLGLFMQLPVDPGVDEAKKMLGLLSSIRALMGA